jgi:membrane fusion protein, multidrug efflux system
MKVHSALALYFALSLTLTSCGKEDADTAPSPEASSTEQKSVTNVRTLRLKSIPFSSSVELTGVTEPWKSVTVAAEIAGRLATVSATEGAYFKQGQGVAHIDTQILAAQRAQAEANYKLTTLQEKWQKQTLGKQVAAAETSYANAASTFTRQQNLYKQQVVSAQTFDNTQTNLNSAKIQLDLQKLTNRSGVELNQQQSRVAATSLQLAKVNLNKAYVSSPISGYVNKVYVEPGEVINPGAPIADIVQTSLIKVVVNIPERDISTVSLGQNVKVKINSLNDEAFNGKVTFISATADVASRTFPVYVQISNVGGKIRGGMISMVEFERSRNPEAIVIEQDTIIDEKSGRYVFVVRDNKAVKVKVELGGRDGTRVVVKEGLKPGDALINFGHRNLLDGDDVNVQEERFQGLPTSTASSAPATTPDGEPSTSPPTKKEST